MPSATVFYQKTFSLGPLSGITVQCHFSVPNARVAEDWRFSNNVREFSDGVIKYRLHDFRWEYDFPSYEKR